MTPFITQEELDALRSDAAFGELVRRLREQHHEEDEAVFGRIEERFFACPQCGTTNICGVRGVPAGGWTPFGFAIGEEQVTPTGSECGICEAPLVGPWHIVINPALKDEALDLA